MNSWWPMEIPLWALFCRLLFGIGLFLMLRAQMRPLPWEKKEVFFAWALLEFLLQLSLATDPYRGEGIISAGIIWAQSVAFTLFLIEGHGGFITPKRRAIIIKSLILAAGIGATLERYQVLSSLKLMPIILFLPGLFWFWPKRKIHRWSFRPYFFMSVGYILIFGSWGFFPFISGLIWCCVLYLQYQVINYFLLKKWIDQGML